MTSQAYALVEYGEQIYCSEHREGAWGTVKLQGSIGTRLSWSDALTELNDRRGSQKELAEVSLCLMLDNPSPSKLAEISSKLEELNANKISFYPMRWMLERFSNGDAPDSDKINQILLDQVSNPGTGLVSASLPIRSATSDSVSEVAADLEAYCKQLQTELAEQKRQQTKLQKDNENLKLRLANHTQLLSDSRVNSYLACIFNNYWVYVSLDDHCIFTGQINKPELRSPVNEPSDTTIRQVASEISRLSSDEHVMLSEICRKLTQACLSLKVRHEFELLLEGQRLLVTGGS
jgi:hypothetical protein